MKEISLKISDIDCAACVERLNRALGGRGGGNAQMICGSVTAPRSAIDAYFKKE